MEIVGLDGEFIIFLQNLSVVYSSNAKRGLTQCPVNAVGIILIFATLKGERTVTKCPGKINHGDVGWCQSSPTLSCVL